MKGEKPMAERKHHGNLVWGSILVILGLIFLLENFGYDIWGQVAKLWPIILIVWGLSKLQAALKTRTVKGQPLPAEKSAETKDSQ